jgi:hypothetical protein
MTLEDFLINLSLRCRVYDLSLVVIRNYERLPKINTGNDIDLIVGEKTINLWLGVIKDLCDDNKLTYKVAKKYYYCTKLEINGVDGKLELDLNNRFEWRGVSFWSTDNLILNAVSYNNTIKTGNSFENCYITFHHSFLYGGFINKKYKIQNEYLIKNSERFFKELKNLGGDYFARIITTALLENKISKNKILVLRLLLLARSFLSRPLSFLKGFLASIYFDLV